MRHSEPDDVAIENEAVHYVPPTDDSILSRLVCALAEVKGRSPEQYDPGLHSLIDLDALERLFESSGRGVGELVLAVDGMEVHIASDGSILIVE